MKVALLSAYDLGRSPTQLACAQAALRAAGHETWATDLAVCSLDVADLERADAVGLLVPMPAGARGFLDQLDDITARARGPIVAFGMFAPAAAAALVAQGVDWVLGSEFESDLVRAVDALAAGRDPIESRDTPARRPAWVTPDREGLLELGRYAKLVPADGGERRLAGALEATRGCKYRCRHCPVPVAYDGRFFAVDEAAVLADARAQVEAGARHLSFSDPDFFNGPRHALRIARALCAAHPKVSWDATIKVEHLVKHRALLPDLVENGCAFVISAFESFDDEVLAMLDKGHTAADIDDALEACAAVGLPVSPTLLPFGPWTTLADYRALLDGIAERGLEQAVAPIQLAIRLLVPKGSLLERDPGVAPHLRLDDADALMHVWVHPDPRVDALARRVGAAAEALAADADRAAFFDAVRAMAAAADGAALPPKPSGARPRATVPYLDEPWYC